MVDQSSGLAACLHLLWDCPGFQGLRDPSLLKEVSFRFLSSPTSPSPTLWVRHTPKLQLFHPSPCPETPATDKGLKPPLATLRIPSSNLGFTASKEHSLFTQCGCYTVC